MKTLIKQVLKMKDQEIWSVRPDNTVFEAIQVMANHDVGALVVMEDDAPIGMFTERDYARNVILEGKSSPTTAVREVMTTPVIYVRPDQTIEECMAIMTEKRVRHLPVLDAKKLVGLVSIGDLVKNVIAEREFTIRQLEQYIRS